MSKPCPHMSNLKLSYLYPGSVKTDVWSFGIVLWEIFTFGETPYNELQSIEVVRFIMMGRRLERPVNCPVPLFKCMSQCWHKDPASRPNMSEIFSQLRQLGGETRYDSEVYGIVAPASNLPDESPEAAKQEVFMGVFLSLCGDGKFETHGSIGTSLAHSSNYYQQTSSEMAVNPLYHSHAKVWAFVSRLVVIIIIPCPIW